MRPVKRILPLIAIPRTPLALFQAHLRQSISANDLVSYDVSADGRRFLINAKVDEPHAASPAIILNWSSEMEK